MQAVVSVLIAEQSRVWQAWEITRPIAESYGALKPLSLDDIADRIAAAKRDLDLS